MLARRKTKGRRRPPLLTVVAVAALLAAPEPFAPGGGTPPPDLRASFVQEALLKAAGAGIPPDAGVLSEAPAADERMSRDGESQDDPSVLGGPCLLPETPDFPARGPGRRGALPKAPGPSLSALGASLLLSRPPPVPTV